MKSITACALLMTLAVSSCCAKRQPHPTTAPSSAAPASRSASHDPQQLAPKAQPDYISGKWSWVTAVIAAAPTKQVATIKRSGDSVVGQVVWLLDPEYSADVSDGKTDGTKVSFDATFVKRDVNLRDVSLKFSYSGTLNESKGWIWGTCTITGIQDGKPVTLEHPWNVFREPATVPLVIQPAPVMRDGGWDMVGLIAREHPDWELPPKNLPELRVPEGTRNLSAKRPVSSSDKDEPLIGSLASVTDGRKGPPGEGYWVELAPGLQWVQVDLGRTCDVYAVSLWPAQMIPESYRCVIVHLSDDPESQRGVTTVFNNDRENAAGLGRGTDRRFVADWRGKLIDAKGARGRYVRIYSNGSDKRRENQWGEIEVHGVPAERATKE